ncbi:MAG: hypothetical protein COB22_07910 [Cycloclasticus sp.]|nr:MAG: hypothetical protein COB22_07910 [Cycloclasticus sp.]
MPDSFNLQPAVMGYTNHGFITDSEATTLGFSRQAGTTQVLLNTARTGSNGAGNTLFESKGYKQYNRAVFPGSFPLPSGELMMLLDDTNTPYILRFSASVAGKDYTLTISIINEFGLIGAENDISESIILPTISLPSALGDDYTLKSTNMRLEQSPDGKSCFVHVAGSFNLAGTILPNNFRRNLAAILRVDISGVVNKSANDAGLSVNQSIFKSTAECSTKYTTEVITASGQLTAEQKTVVDGAPTDVSGSRVIEQSIRRAYFDDGGGVHFYGATSERTSYHINVELEGDPSEVASPAFHDVTGVQFDGANYKIKRAMSCLYFNSDDALPVDDWTGIPIAIDTLPEASYATTNLFPYFKGVWEDLGGVDQDYIYVIKDESEDGFYETSPQPTVVASKGIYAPTHQGDRFVTMQSNDPRVFNGPLLVYPYTSGFGTIDMVDSQANLIVYDNINGQIREADQLGSFQPIPVGFVSSAVII